LQIYRIRGIQSTRQVLRFVWHPPVSVRPTNLPMISKLWLVAVPQFKLSRWQSCWQRAYCRTSGETILGLKKLVSMPIRFTMSLKFILRMRSMILQGLFFKNFCGSWCLGFLNSSVDVVTVNQELGRLCTKYSLLSLKSSQRYQSRYTYSEKLHIGLIFIRRGFKTCSVMENICTLDDLGRCHWMVS
jgi:hypothetical protein